MGVAPINRRLEGQAAYLFFKRRQISNCVFCGKSPVTKEHTWSRWLRRHIRRRMTKWETFKATEHRTEIESGVKVRPGDPHDWQISCVCSKCNNGWMSQIEKRVRPVLGPLAEGVPFRVTEQDQSILAIWCILKTMVAEFDDPERVTTHHMQRKRMCRRQLAPSKGWRVWIGHFDRDAWAPYYIINTLSILPGPPPLNGANVAVKRYNTQSVTQIVGKLFIHVIHSPYRELVSRWVFPVPVQGKLRQIWPLTGYSFVWPPDPMTDGIADAAAQAFFAFCRDGVARQRSD